MLYQKMMFLVLVVSLLFVATVAGSNAAPVPRPTTLTGTFSIIWGDPAPDSNAEPTMDYWLTDAQGNMTQILLDENLARSYGGVLALDGQRVTLAGEPVTDASGESPQLRAQSLVNRETVQRPDPFPATPWVSIACKFADVAAEPKTIAYMRDMYRFEYPGLGDYFDRQAGDFFSIGDSRAYGWFTLPKPKSGYTKTDGTFKYLAAAYDCFKAADPTVDFSEFFGLQLLFNDYVVLDSTLSQTVNRTNGVGIILR